MSISFKQRVSLAIQILRYGALPTKARREIPAITDEEVAEARFFFPMDKFFVFGHARSGTTILARLIRLHPEVHCDYQAHFFTRPPLLESLVADEAFGKWLARRSNRWNRGKDLSPVFLRAAADFTLEREARRVGKQIVGDKSPSSLMDGKAVLLMHKVYPEARLIYIVRDGRDTVLSHRFQTFIDLPDHLSKEDLQIRSDFSQNPDPFLEGKRSIFTEKGIFQAAEGWVRNVGETNQLGESLYKERYFSLRFEDLMQNPWEKLLQIWLFLGASQPDAQLQDQLIEEMEQNRDAQWQEQKSIEIARSLQKGKQGSWKEIFTPRDQEIFHKVAGKTLETWGYSH